MNKTVISGNLCHDAETTATNSDTGLVSFTIANNDKRIKGQDGYQSIPCFILVKVWTKKPDKFLFKKGDPVIVDGLLIYEQWTDNGGNKQSRHVIETSHYLSSGWPVMKIHKDVTPF